MNAFKRKDYGTWNVWQTSYSMPELKKRRAQLAKVANSRILALERAKSDITGNSFIEGHQYNIVLDYLESQRKKRFSESKTKKFTEHQIKMEITVLENFLAMKTSTVGGARKSESATVQTFIDKGIPEDIAGSPDFYDFLSSQTFEELVKNVTDSEDIIDLIESASDEGYSVSDIIGKFEDFRGKTRKDVWSTFGLKPI